MSSENLKENLRENGYALFPQMIPEYLTNAALEAIERDLQENYNPERKIEYDNTSFCPDLRALISLRISYRNFGNSRHWRKEQSELRNIGLIERIAKA